ncbi:MAG: ABC transporter permease [Roseivirga sp.]
MNKNKPPLFALTLLKWFCKPEYHTDVEGDLIESYEENLTKGRTKANWLLYKDVLQLFRPGIIRPVSLFKTSSSGLWQSNIKSAFRSLFKKKAYSLINIMGLSLGIACTLLVLLYVQYEFSYDKFIPESERIYKLVEERKTPEGITPVRTVPYSFARTIPQDFPEVAGATAFSGPYNGQQVYVNDTQGKRLHFLEDNVLLADHNFFSVLNLKLLDGDATTALKEPNSVVLTESTAKRFFGDTNALGQFISAMGRNSVVTGICEDLPGNSHLKFSYLVSSSTVSWFSRDDFTLKYTHCYLKLHENTEARQLETKFPAMVETYMAAEIARINQTSWEEYQQAGNEFNYYLKPLTSIHLDPENPGGMKAGGSINTISILIAIAILIFIIACVNFINLATARSAERAREVGVRKVMGSHRFQLIVQFLTESITLSFLSLLFAIGLVMLALPYFNTLAERELTLSLDLQAVISLVVFGCFVGLLAGVYPAFALSSFKPVLVLKGSFSSQVKGKWLRNGLVVFQFWIAIVLIICTFTIRQQVDYMSDKNLGFDKEQLMVIEGTFDRKGNFAHPFLNEIRNLPQVKEAAGTLWLHGFRGTRTETYMVEGADHEVNMERVTMGDDLDKVLDLSMVKGEFFSENTIDSSMMLINETAAKKLGLNEPIGKRVAMVTHDQGLTQKTYYTVKGVIKDFNYQSLHTDIAPLIVLSNELYASRMIVIATRLNAGMTREGITAIESKWKAMVPEFPFRFRFLDDVLDKSYQSEQRSSQVFSLFSGLSIFISVIGLFTLSAYTVNTRAKEIGIRKVIGASVNSILKLLSMDFLKMVLLASLLAFPVAWYAMEMWLDDFAYRVALNPVIFILSGALILIITWATVGYQSLKAARANPIRHIQNE